MGKNWGRFLCREEDTYENGDRGITDTFVTDNGELEYHIYNVSADGSEHSHQVTDEDGETLYCREISDDPDHPWRELDRTFAINYLRSLSQDNLKLAISFMNKNELEVIKDIIINDDTKSGEMNLVRRLVK